MHRVAAFLWCSVTACCCFAACGDDAEGDGQGPVGGQGGQGGQPAQGGERAGAGVSGNHAAGAPALGGGGAGGGAPLGGEAGTAGGTVDTAGSDTGGAGGAGGATGAGGAAGGPGEDPAAVSGAGSGGEGPSSGDAGDNSKGAPPPRPCREVEPSDVWSVTQTNRSRYTAPLQPNLGSESLDYFELTFHSPGEGLFRLTEEDARYESCARCLLVRVPDETPLGRFFIASSGVLEIHPPSNATLGVLDASITDVRFVEIVLDETFHSTLVPAGECLHVASAVVEVGGVL